ncbi:glycosyltransferase [Consotaella salsifontis]|uniref:glycosyltransferase n=1 Tax=Consotaella salsifontis TaxID=1365950 RepID=UPI002477E969|nr:glycosyltransferase [Consotaella salsifontis]
MHYWLVGMRGGERVLEEILSLFPTADLFTHVAIRENLSEALRNRPITETFIGRLPFARKHYARFLPLMPLALEELDLSGYDLVISSESGPAKGVIAPPGSVHVCYCHSPMRYVWDQYGAYRQQLGPLGRLAFSVTAHGLRTWDVATAARVDQFVANSAFVAERIRRYYKTEAKVVHPPVELSAFSLPREPGTGDYFLFVSELVGYKRADLVVEAFNRLRLPLVVVGDGKEAPALARRASPNICLTGRVSQERLVELYQNARALVFPALEDFGIVPLEAMACGVPVIAYSRGGARESVVAGKTGLFFDEQNADAIIDAVERFETQRATFDRRQIAAHAQKFSPEVFRKRFRQCVDGAIARARRRDAASTGRTGVSAE